MTKKLLFILLASSGFTFAQNSCAEAVAITAGQHIVEAVNGSEIPLPICADNGEGATAGEWFTYTPTANYFITITTDLAINNSRDTRFHVYTGSCGAFACFNGDDDSGSNYTSVASFNVTAGTTYYIAFDNRWSSGGFTFELTENEPVVSLFTFASTPLPVPGGFRDCVVDMNGDFLDDIVVVNDESVSIMYQQANGTFTTATLPTPDANFLPTWSIAAGDIDRNGKTDLLYGSGNGVTFMIQNNEGTGFTESSGPDYVFSQRSNFSDLNNDGHLDAFVCHDVEPNVYYINDGEGNLDFFQGGMGDFPSGGNYGSIFVDYDNDGDSDLFIAKCRGGNSGAKIDELHRNDGNGIFTNVSEAAGMAEPSQSWSSAWADFDNDGWMDAMIGVSSFADGGHKLRKNNGNGTFTDITEGSGFETLTSTSIEYVAHDFDNDGWVDVLCNNNTIMRNNGDMTFTKHIINANSGPIGDLNNDGRLDILNGTNVYSNISNNNNYLVVHVQGVQSNRNGLGARVEIYGAWGKQIRDVRSGEGFRYMNSMNVHFGLGTATEIEKVIIRWPSGNVDQIENPAINAPLFVLEGSSPLSNNEIASNQVMLYPNPASDVIYLNTGTGAEASVKVYDLTGKVVLSGKTLNSSLNVASLATGQYMLLIEDTNARQSVKKLIKK
mgnify:CR=1 FL=1